MKLMIASDIHGAAGFCREMLAAYDREQAKKLLLLGDILYHGPRNDLPEGYAPKEVLAMLNARKEEILCVRGNCDTEVDQMVLEFPILAEYCILYVNGRMIFVTHGHNFNEKNLPMLKKGDILLHGHTHVQGGGTLCIPESRFRVHSQGRKLARLHDAGGWPFYLEGTGWDGKAGILHINGW